MQIPISVLAVVPEPSDVPWAGAARGAWDALSAGAAAAGTGVRVTRLAPATAAAFDEAAGEPFQVVHIVGRGTSRPAARHGTLALEASDRRARDLNVQNVCRILSRIPGLELVVIQSLGTRGELDVLRDNAAQCASVVLLPAEGTGVIDAGVTGFARLFYGSLARGADIQTAFGRATENPGALPTGRASGPTLLLREKPVEAAGAPVTTAPHPVTAPSPSVIMPAAETRESDGEAAMARQVERKRSAGAFDVFLCHNVADKPAVMEVGRRLMAHGLLPWLDLWELRPGMPWQRLLEEQIANIRAAAVFVGRDGIGPWQRQELDGFLREFNQRGCPVIPVMLPGAAGEPQLPLFLRGMTWVDFRAPEPDPLAQLLWGITGERPRT